MRARIWGCRGSLASPGPATVRYGGNTSCLEVRPSDGSLIVVDAGTGARNLGIALGDERPDRIDILLSHLHLDHIEGLGFFGPVWDSGCEVHIWGPPSPSMPSPTPPTSSARRCSDSFSSRCTASTHIDPSF